MLRHPSQKPIGLPTRLQNGSPLLQSQHLFWATGYNVIALPLAAGFLYNIGVVISPAIGAALMSLSTVIVAINANFLKVKK